ncbi:MAG: hypothetical protein JW940_03395, partial [Polyangiaceae bacterium]|nr:hypothetical protein [Polyangiaceae bacterium]
GQRLCRRCYGTYLAAVADKRARAHGAYRRCACGEVLAPAGVAPKPFTDGGLNLEYFFQADRYACSACGVTFELQHDAIVGLVALVFLVLVIGTAMAGRSEYRLAWAAVSLVQAGWIGWQVFQRLRHPRVG